jgi:hypothetical protein
MRQPHFESSNGTAIVGSTQRMGDLELPPKHLLHLETVEQIPGRQRLHLRVGCDDAQPPLSDAPDPLGGSPSQ